MTHSIFERILLLQQLLLPFKSCFSLHFFLFFLRLLSLHLHSSPFANSKIIKNLIRFNKHILKLFITLFVSRWEKKFIAAHPCAFPLNSLLLGSFFSSFTFLWCHFCYFACHLAHFNVYFILFDPGHFTIMVKV